MIDINKEAEKFLRFKGLTGQQNRTIAEWMVAFANNSKATQAKVIQAQINVLRNIQLPLSKSVADNSYEMIEQFEQQLKQLQND